MNEGTYVTHIAEGVELRNAIRGTEEIMTSEARIAANVANAKNSTGPRTESGKERSRMNAVKHGMTAKTLLLPDENPDEFREPARMGEGAEATRPSGARDGRKGVLLFVATQQGGACPVGAAELPSAHEGSNRSGSHRAGSGGAWSEAFSNAEWTTGCGCLPGAWRTVRRGEASRRSFDDADHPATLIGGLEASLSGCEWLIERFGELKAILESDQVWHGPERFRAFRLLRVHPSDAYFSRHLTRFLHACEVMDPTAGSLIGEVWNDPGSADALPALEEAYRRALTRERALDQIAAQRYLLDIINGELERLNDKLAEHERRAEIELALAADLLAFDDSKEAELLRRYEASCDKKMHRNMNELQQRHKAKAGGGNAGFGFREAAEPFAGSIESTFLNIRTQRSRVQTNGGATAGGSAVTASGGRTGGDHDPVRNEANGVSGLRARCGEQLRNEPKLSGERTAVDGTAPRSEANGCGMQDSQNKGSQDVATESLKDAGAGVRPIELAQEVIGSPGSYRRDRGHGNAVGASRRERKRRDRKRRNAERAEAAKATAEAGGG